MKKKIELMLEIYRERLEKANKNFDHVEGIRLEAQISILETLYICAIEENNEIGIL